MILHENHLYLNHRLILPLVIIVTIVALHCHHPHQPSSSTIILLLLLLLLIIIRSSSIGSKSTQLRKTSSHPKVHSVKVKGKKQETSSRHWSVVPKKRLCLMIPQFQDGMTKLNRFHEFAKSMCGNIYILHTVK